MKCFKTVLTIVLVALTAACFTACIDSPDKYGGLSSGNSGEITQTPSGDSDNTQSSGNVSGNIQIGNSGEISKNPNSGNSDNTTQTPSSGNQDETTQTPVSGNETQTSPKDDEQKILVVYFSCTNTTKGWAQTLQTRLDADIYEIAPAVPYTDDDLKYYTDCRADGEQSDPTARPQINGTIQNIAQYDVIYIGYPIWHGQAPKIIYTFLESYDFTGKTLIPFCTSASSPMSSSGTNLHSCAPAAIWKSGCRVSSSSNIDTLINMK